MTDADLTLRDEVAEVLAGHVGSERGGRGAWCVKCLCGYDTPTMPYPGDAWDAHRKHQADALLPLLARVREEGEARVRTRVDPDNSALMGDWNSGVRAAVAEAMLEHGPDGHVDGYEEIAAAAVTAVRAALAEPSANLPKQVLAADSVASEASGVSVDPDEDGRGGK